VETARADFRAVAHRIPRRIRPFNFRIVTHVSRLICTSARWLP
jgi:hypothetical protein